MRKVLLGLVVVGVVGAALLVARERPAGRAQAPAPVASSPPASPSTTPVEVPGRASIGTGHVLLGVVSSASDGRPVGGARVLLWLVAEDGRYHDDHRATIVTGGSGGYWFQSNFPPSYGPPPHIHVQVSADGYRPLETECMLTRGQTQTRFDLALQPA